MFLFIKNYVYILFITIDRVKDCSDTYKGSSDYPCNSGKYVKGYDKYELYNEFNIIIAYYSCSSYDRNIYNGIRYSSLDYLNIIQCIRNEDGGYESKTVHGYICDSSDSQCYTISYSGSIPVKSKINTAAINSNDCSENVGGLIQVFGEGPIYFCFSENKGVEFFKNDGNYLFNINEENVFVNTTNSDYTSFAIRAYTFGKLSGFFFNYFTGKF